MCAEVALVGGAGIGVDEDGVVRTGIHTCLAANAAAVVEVDDAVVPSEERIRGADRDARGIVTVVAAHHRVEAPRVGKDPLFDVLNPGPVDPQRNTKLRLAGDGAGVAADARILVDEESEPGHHPFSIRRVMRDSRSSTERSRFAVALLHARRSLMVPRTTASNS